MGCIGLYKVEKPTCTLEICGYVDDRYTTDYSISRISRTLKVTTPRLYCQTARELCMNQWGILRGAESGLWRRQTGY